MSYKHITLHEFNAILLQSNIAIELNELTKQTKFKGLKYIQEEDALARLESLCIGEGFNPQQVVKYTRCIANMNASHPIRDWIERVQWDGTDRWPEFYDTIQSNTNNYQVYMYRWAMSAIAALYEDNFSADGVLTLVGKQGIGKSRWATLLMHDHSWLKLGCILNPNSKDSVMECTSSWISELGEVDATFRKSDIAQLKAFITNNMDLVRLPYDRTASRFPRRTVFYATVNDPNFLSDDENRRFWTVDCKRFNIPTFDITQFWAQVYAEYCAYKQSGNDNAQPWRLTNLERYQLQIDQNGFKVIDPIHQLLEQYISKPNVNDQYENLSCTQILQKLPGIKLSKAETNSAGRWLRENGYSIGHKSLWKVIVTEPDMFSLANVVIPDTNSANMH